MSGPEAAISGLDPAALAETRSSPPEAGGVLLVEDEPSLFLLLEQLFQRAHRKVFIATSAGQALTEFAGHQAEISLALVDCQLPDMHGGELCRRLRDRSPRLPLLLTSGRDQRALTAALALSGPTGFLPKPYLPGELVSRVDQLLRAE